MSSADNDGNVTNIGLIVSMVIVSILLVVAVILLVIFRNKLQDMVRRRKATRNDKIDRNADNTP